MGEDIFSLNREPKKTLLIGAGYISLECAGFLTGLGFDTTVMARGQLLRGFDQDMAEHVGDYMKSYGTKFLRACNPQEIQKMVDDEGVIVYNVKWTDSEGVIHEDVYNTVVMAVGRVPSTSNLGLESANVNFDKKSFKIPVRL